MTAGSEFVRYMISLYMFSTLPAKQLCTLRWWAAKAGIGEATPFAHRPGSTSGQYARKAHTRAGATALGWKREKGIYELDVPGHERHDLERTLHTISTLPAHEQLAADMETDVAFRVRLREQLASRDVPAVYWEHPVVLAAGGKTSRR